MSQPPPDPPKYENVVGSSAYPALSDEQTGSSSQDRAEDPTQQAPPVPQKGPPPPPEPLSASNLPATHQPPPPYTPHPGHPPPITTQPTAVIVETLVLHDQPTHCRCPNCRHDIVTETRVSAGLCTWIAVGVLFAFCWVCSCLPLFVDSCQDVEHRCPNCKYYIGRFKRL